MQQNSRGADYYFIGIGGTAMGGTAVALQQMGNRVAGSDAGVYPPMSDYLAQSNIAFHTGFDAAHLTGNEKCVVVGNAIPRGNAELEEALNRRLPLVSLPQVIASEFIADRESIVVAGTHGKTTTSSLLAALFLNAGLEPGWLIGGVIPDLPASVQLGAGRFFICEGDEYDTAFFDKRSKFLQYRPTTAIINAIEFDHADIFPDFEAVKTTFRRFINLIPGNGSLLVHGEDPTAIELSEHAFCPVLTFGLGVQNDFHGSWLENGRARIDGPGGWHVTCSPRLIGDHNLCNLIVAAAVAHRHGIADSVIQTVLEQFQGPRRRLETTRLRRAVLVDDFAHHPTAIRLTLQTLRQHYPGYQLLACFEPRSNTLVRNVLQNELTAALALADVVGIGALHRRELYKPEERLDLDRLSSELEQRETATLQSDDNDVLIDFLLSRLEENAVIAVLSNGAFGGLLEQLKERLGPESV
ncbi:MAG: UDP-N-acetylmuramate--alanine ligase [Candidatus Delongbacteria bacterium]|nr:UDP-N-acetylmuramate--alanine ligase [Candidatus Delongbacteria bacterium]